MAGYISLFFDDARMSLPTVKLEEAKKNIFSNYKQVLRRPDFQTEKDIRDIINNTILKEMESQMQQANGSSKNKSDPIRYWDITLGQMYSCWNKEMSEIENADKILKYIPQVYNALSDAISKSNGIVSTNIIADMKKEKAKLQNIEKQIGAAAASGDGSVRSLFFGSLKSTIMRAQGSIHEAAGILAAHSAKTFADKKIAEKNKELKFIIEHSGGKLIESSELAAAIQHNGMELGTNFNPKNDITIAIQDGNGSIIWHTGLSLKSTSSKEPSLVKIMSQDLTTLLNKTYDINTYLNIAASLGIGDWSHRRAGIGPIAQKQNLSTLGTTLSETWKEVIYNSIYLQVIDMFTGVGTGGILNNVEYLIINSKPISVYDIFSKMESQQSNDIHSIKGIQISGAEDAAKRQQYVNKNIDSFIKDIDNNPLTTAEERILRSSSAWDSVYKTLQDKKITISLKYADLIGGATR